MDNINKEQPTNVNIEDNTTPKTNETPRQKLPLLFPFLTNNSKMPKFNPPRDKVKSYFDSIARNEVPEYDLYAESKKFYKQAESQMSEESTE